MFCDEHEWNFKYQVLKYYVVDNYIMLTIGVVFITGSMHVQYFNCLLVFE